MHCFSASASGCCKMSTVEAPNTDPELGFSRRRRLRFRQPGSSETTTDASFRFSDSEDDEQSWHSPLNPNDDGGSHDECRFAGIRVSIPPRTHREMESSGPDCSSSEEEEIDLESGELELKMHSGKEERECRICHLSLVGGGNNGGNGEEDFEVAMELGCSCKGDLGAAHRQCAETWFKIKGNTSCEICGATALNVAGEQANEANNDTGTAGAAAPPPVRSETWNFWHGRRIMNFLLACMVFAFVISWLFHFNVLP